MTNPPIIQTKGTNLNLTICQRFYISFIQI